MKSTYAIIFACLLAVTIQTHAQSSRKSEGISRQITALQSSLDSFSTVVRSDITNIEEHLDNTRACAIDGLAYVPNHQESDSRGCFRPIFTVEEDIVSDLCISSYNSGTNSCSKCDGDASDWTPVGSWDNDDDHGQGHSYSSLADTAPERTGHWMVNLCAKRGTANIEVGQRFFSDLCISSYNSDTISCAKCDGDVNDWKVVGSWDNDDNHAEGHSYSSLADTSPERTGHWMVNLCARIETAGE